MHTIGIDLAVKGEHKAVVVNEGGRFISPVLNCRTTPEALAHLLAAARRGNESDELQVVMEPTGMAWFPVAVWLLRQGVTVYLVNSQQVADLRRYYKKHAKSDRIDCRVLAKLPLVNAEKLHPLELPGATTLACQRGCKELARLGQQCTAIRNRLIALDRFAWPSLEEDVFADLFSKPARWFRMNWYNPAQVLRAGVDQIRQTWQDSMTDINDSGDWAVYLVGLARQVLELYGSQNTFLDYDLLQAEARREQTLLDFLETMEHQVRLKIVYRQYRKLHPSRNLETLMGVGQDGAAVYASFVGNPQRFASLRAHRGWSGMIPNSKQSASSQLSGLKITQAGPRLIKKFAYLDAEVARLYDPQIAAIYYDQMVNKGKHHSQAICACATHLLDRILIILRQDRPYQLQDVNGTPVSKQEARLIIAERYTVPEDVRQRNNRRRRREQVEKYIEKKQMRESGILVNGVAISSPSE